MLTTCNGKIRILQLGHKRIPSREGGIEIVVEELSTRMAKLGHEVTCYNRKRRQQGRHEHKNEFYKGVHIKGVPTIDLKGLSAVSSSVSGAIGAAFGAYDVVHFHAEGTAVFCWIPKLFGKRVVVTIHGLDWQRAKWGKLARFYIKCGEWCAVKFADEIIVLNRANQAYFRENYNRKTVYIPNGVNRPNIRRADQISRQYGLQKNDYILYLGRLVPEKGLKDLIRAFQKVSTDKKLVIAGGISDTKEFVKEIKQMAKQDKRILFTGFMEGNLLEELYSNAYLFVLPSEVEGMPISLLEAMSYGNCCLVSDIPGCTEVVEDQAVIFKQGNIRDLERKLQRMCEDEKMIERYRMHASDYICNKFDWNQTVEKTIRLYKK